MNVRLVFLLALCILLNGFGQEQDHSHLSPSTIVKIVDSCQNMNEWSWIMYGSGVAGQKLWYEK